MTVTTETNKVVNLGNGATTIFSYAFIIPTGTDVVTFTDSDGTSTVLATNQYTITGLDNPAGGTVTYPLTGSPIALGETLTIARIVPFTQEVDLINQDGFYPQVVEGGLDTLEYQIQQLEEVLGRCIKAPITDENPPAELPPATQRANMSAFFDADGNLTAGTDITPGTTVSAAMIPVVTAITLALARTALGLGTMAVQNANAVAITGGTISGVTLTALTAPLLPADGGTGKTTYGPITGQTQAKTAAYAILNADKGKTFHFAGTAYYTVTLGAAGGFDADFQVRIYNADTGRGKLISINGITAFILWPLQTIVVSQNTTSSGWIVSPREQRWRPSSAVNFFVDPVLGSDSNDGLATGTGAFLTIQHAVDVVYKYHDPSLGGGPVINLADGTHNVSAGVVIVYSIGTTQFYITGNNTTPTNCIVSCSAAGFCFFGRDGAGTVTISGIKFQTTGNGSTAMVISQFFQMDLGNGDNANRNNFGAFPVGSHITVTDLGSWDITSGYTVSGNMVTHIAASGLSKLNYGSFTISVPGALTFTLWLAATNLAWVNMGGVALTFTGAGAGAGSTGTKYAVQSNSVAQTTGTVFPGATAGSVSTGGIYV